MRKLVPAAFLILAAGSVALVAAGTRPASPAPVVERGQAAVFEVDAVHSSLIFKIQHVGVSNFYGRFNDYSGTFSINPENLSASSIEVTVKADSVDSGNEGRDGHLRNPDFFNTKQFPDLTFKSTSISKGEDEGEYLLKGELTVLGVTKPIEATLRVVGERDVGGRMGYRAGIEAVFAFKRSDFGMTYGVANGALSDEVTIMAALEGMRK